MKTKGSRIKHLRKVRGLTQDEFAAGLDGVTRGAVGNWERDQGVKQENLEQIATRYGCSFEWLATGRGPAPTESDARSNDVEQANPAGPTTVDVPEMEIRAGAGAQGYEVGSGLQEENGASYSVDIVRDHWFIPASFLQGELRISRDAARILEVYGDSGYDPANPGAPGSLFPGDRVVCDTNDKRPSPPGPFVVWDGVGLVVKLVEVVIGTDPVRLRLRSRNPSYNPYEATEDEARIVGRVRARFSAM